MFLINNYSSVETYDIAKMVDWISDCYDLLDSPFLNLFLQLPIVDTYDTSNRYKNIDQISQDYYGSPFYTFYIMYFNGLQTEIFNEGVVLNMFSLTDMANLYQNISNGNIV